MKRSGTSRFVMTRASRDGASPRSRAVDDPAARSIEAHAAMDLSPSTEKVRGKIEVKPTISAR